MITGKLYFVNKDGEREFVSDLHEDGKSWDDIYKEDLKKRNPHFESYYTRCWLDKDDEFWIDYGSHTEFYVVVKG